MSERSATLGLMDRCLRPFLPARSAGDPDTAQRARFLVAGALLAALGTLSLVPQLDGEQTPPHLWAVVVIGISGALLVLALVRTGRVVAASHAFPSIAIGLGALMTICEGNAAGRTSVLIVGVIMAGLLVRPVAALCISAVAVAAVAMGHIAAVEGWITPRPPSPDGAWLSSIRMIVLSGLLVTLLAATLRSSIDRLRERERELTLSLAELERARATEQAAHVRLRQSEKLESIGRLAGGVAHDFNNLLTVMLGNASLMLKGETDRQLPEEILAAAQRGAQLTGQLLALSKQQPKPPQLLGLHRALEELCPLLQRLLGEAIEIETRLEATSDNLRADPSRIDQVLVNLALNAQAAMPGGGTLRFHTRDAETAGRFQLEVRDSGEGLSPEIRERIFEPFFSTRATGTGLGLATVDAALKELGGSIRVESQPGSGTSFFLEFPCDESADDPPAATEGTTGTAYAPVGPVLLVEDDSSVRRTVRKLLESLGHDVLTVDGAEEVRAALRARSTPVLLTVIDVVLAKAFGPDVAAAVRALQPGCPVLFISGYTAGELEQRRIDASDGLLTKPFTAAQLQAAMAAQIAHARSELSGPFVRSCS